MKSLFIIAILLFSFASVNAQNSTLKGAVFSLVDGQRLGGSSLVLTQGTKTIAFAYSDIDGEFKLNFIAKETTDILLKTSSLGHETKTIVIPFDDLFKNIEYKISLAQKIESLNTVVLKADQKIKINRDTIAFKVSVFQDQTERTVEDLLKNLPGIEVSEDGNITALGVAIQKILIEGDDLADSNYKVISKNLSIDLIDKIEIINNYDENPVLKQFLNSENVVLNLKLKDDKKSILFGKVSFGGGIENRFAGDADIGLINPNVKFLNLSNANNVGFAAGENFGTYTFTATGFNNFSKDYSIDINPMINLSGSSNELEDANYIENKSFSNNLLVNKKYRNGLQLRNSLFVYNDDFEKELIGKYQYLVNPEPIFFSEDNFFIKNNSNFKNDITLTYSPESNINITFNNTLVLENENHNNRLLFFEDTIFQALDNRKKEIESQIQITKKTKQGALVIDGYFGSKNLQQNFSITPNTFNIMESDDTLKTEQSIYIDYQGIEGTSIYKKENTLYSITGALLHLREGINSKSFFINKTSVLIDSLSGRNTSNSISPKLQFKFQQKLLENVFFNTEISTSAVYYNKNTFSDTFTLFNPDVSLRINKTKTGSYRFSYKYKNEIPRLSYLLENPIVQNYRSLQSGIINPEVLKNHNYGFGYTFSKIKKRILLNSRISYTTFLNEISYENFVNENSNISQYTIVPGQNFLVVNSNFTTYIRQLKSTLKFGYTFQNSSKPVELNNSVTRIINSTNTYIITGTSYFKKSFNFKFLSRYRNFIGSNGNEKSENNQFKFGVKPIFTIKDKWVASLQTNAYIINKKLYESNNLEITFKPNNSNWNYSLNVQNIFNSKRYVFENISEFIESSTTFIAVPRYIYLQANVSF